MVHARRRSSIPGQALLSVPSLLLLGWCLWGIEGAPPRGGALSPVGPFVRDPARASVSVLEAAADDVEPPRASAVPVPRPDPPPCTPEIVRVEGVVRGRGLPRPRFDLSFRALDGAREGEEIDWTFTDERGRFEVELPAARFRVLDGRGEEIVSASIPEDADEHRLDLDVPLPPSGRPEPGH